MNVDKGAKVLEQLANQNAIQVPCNFTTFKYSSLPDFEKIAENSKHGISIYLAVPHLFLNGSLAKRFIRYLGSKHTRQEDLIVGRNGLHTDEIPEFLAEARERVKRAYYKNIFDGVEAPNDFVGVTYQSWVSDQVDHSYILKINGDKENPHYILQLSAGNPDGWDFCADLSISGHRSDLQTRLQEEHNIDQTVLELIGEQASRIFTSVPLDIVVLEGKLMNSNYPVVGPMIIDLYEGYSGESKSLGHSGHIRSFEKLTSL